MPLVKWTPLETPLACVKHHAGSPQQSGMILTSFVAMLSFLANYEIWGGGVTQLNKLLFIADIERIEEETSYIPFIRLLYRIRCEI